MDAGQIPPLDLVQAEAEVAQRRENLIQAQDDRRRRRGSSAPADHGSGRRVVLAGRSSSPSTSRPSSVRRPTWTRRSPTRSASRFDLARARARSRQREDERRLLSAIRRLPDVRLEDVVSRQRARRHAVPAHRRLSRHRHRDARSELRRRARPGVQPRLPDVERRRDRQLSARTQLRRGEPRARGRRAPPGGAADREPAARRRGDGAPGGAPGAEHRRARRRGARRRDAGRAALRPTSSGATTSGCRRRFS